MLQAFIIVAREGLESFLIVAVLLTYLKKTGRQALVPAVYSGIAASVFLSIGLSFLLAQATNTPLIEGILALVTAVFVASLIIHMWRLGPSFKREMEQKLEKASSIPAKKSALIGVFLVTTLLITREGMETALMLFQVKNGRFILGSFIGLAAAAIISCLWVKYSHLVNLRRFFQATGAYLVIFLAQVLLYAFHEFCEAGVFANSDAWHHATEPYSPDGMYGRWFSFITVIALGAWVVWAAFMDHAKRKKKETQFQGEISHGSNI